MSGINVDLFHEHLFFSECLSPDMKFGAQTCIISVIYKHSSGKSNMLWKPNDCIFCSYNVKKCFLKESESSAVTIPSYSTLFYFSILFMLPVHENKFL